jgi:hypothetical protein
MLDFCPNIVSFEFCSYNETKKGYNSMVRLFEIWLPPWTVDM